MYVVRREVSDRCLRPHIGGTKSRTYRLKGRRVKIGQRWIRRFSCSPHRLHPSYLAHQVAPRESTLSLHSQQGKVCSSPPSPGSVQPTLSIPEDAACVRAPSASHLTRLRHRRPSSRRNLAFCGSLRDSSPRLISSSTYLRSIGFYKQRVPSDERQLIGKVVILLADLGAKSHAHSHRTRKNFMRPCNLRDASIICASQDCRCHEHLGAKLSPPVSKNSSKWQYETMCPSILGIRERKQRFSNGGTKHSPTESRAAITNNVGSPCVLHHAAVLRRKFLYVDER